MTRVTIQLSYRTPEGADRFVNVPAEATDYAEGDLGAALAAIIVALHDRVTTLERITAQTDQPYVPSDDAGWGDNIEPEMGEGLFSEAEAQAAAEAQTYVEPDGEGPRDV